MESKQETKVKSNFYLTKHGVDLGHTLIFLRVIMEEMSLKATLDHPWKTSVTLSGTITPQAGRINFPKYYQWARKQYR